MCACLCVNVSVCPSRIVCKCGNLHDDWSDCFYVKVKRDHIYLSTRGEDENHPQEEAEAHRAPQEEAQPGGTAGRESEEREQRDLQLTEEEADANLERASEEMSACLTALSEAYESGMAGNREDIDQCQANVDRAFRNYDKLFKIRAQIVCPSLYVRRPFYIDSPSREGLFQFSKMAGTEGGGEHPLGGKEKTVSFDPEVVICQPWVASDDESTVAAVEGMLQPTDQTMVRLIPSGVAGRGEEGRSGEVMLFKERAKVHPRDGRGDGATLSVGDEEAEGEEEKNDKERDTPSRVLRFPLRHLDLPGTTSTATGDAVLEINCSAGRETRNTHNTRESFSYESEENNERELEAKERNFSNERGDKNMAAPEAAAHEKRFLTRAKLPMTQAKLPKRMRDRISELREMSVLLVEDEADVDTGGEAHRPRRASPKAKVRLQNRKVEALIDTGADISVISEEYLFENPHLLQSFRRIKPFVVRAANAGALDIVGMTTATVTLGRKSYFWNFIVIGNLKRDLILGSDFLHYIRANIDFYNRILHHGRTSAQDPLDLLMESSEEINSLNYWDAEYLVRSKMHVKIPGNSADHVKVQLDVGASGGDFDVHEHVLSREEGNGDGLMVAPGVVHIQENDTAGIFILRVINTSDEEIVIKEGSIVTVATPRMVERDEKKLEMPAWDSNGKSDSVALNEIAFIMATGMNPDEWADGTSVNLDNPDKFAEQLKTLSDEMDVTPDVRYSDMSVIEQALFTEMVRSMKQAFTPDKEIPGKTDLVKLSLNTGDNSPAAIPPRRLPYAYEQFVFDKIQSWLKHEIIRPSSSRWAAPCVVVKQGEKLRLVIDYRELNKRLDDKDLHYPITLIDSCLDVMNGARYFTVMDISGAYHQVEIEEDSKEKTAFVSKFGQYEFNRCPFGIKSLPGLWARLADKVLEGLKWQIANVFFDDICIFSRTAADHIRDVGLVLQRIIKAGLKIHMSKCKWARKEVEFLGFRVGRDGIKPMEDKVQAVMDFPAPRTLTELRSFLSLASYYRRFIEGFSTIAGPLNELLQKKTIWRWGKEQREAFMALKHSLCSKPVLAYPDFDLPFVVYTDASNYGLGAILAQQHPDGTMRVVAYASRSLHGAEKQYAPTHKEALAVRWAVEKWRAYLLGRHFTIFTDHKALEQLDSFKDTTGQLFRWSLFLQDFDYTIIYRPGRTHQNADAISRSPALLDLSITTIEAILGDDLAPGDGAVAAKGEDWSLSELFWEAEIAEAESVCMLESERESEGVCMCEKDLCVLEREVEQVYKMSDIEQRLLFGRSTALSQFGIEGSEILIEKTGEPDVLHINAATTDDSPISMMNEDGDGWSLSCDVKLLQRADEKLKPIIDLLEAGVLPEGMTEMEERRLRREAESYYIRPKDDVLMRIWAAARSRKRITAFHQVVLPEPLVHYVLKAYHEHALGGHLGFAKTYEKILRKYYWPSVYKDVSEFVRGCQVCGSRKNPTRTKRYKLGQRPPAWKPFQRVSADFVRIACPSKKGNKMVLVVIDHLSHWIELFACKEETAEVVADCLYKEIACRYGCPGELHSDNGSQFTSEVIKELTALLGIDRSTTTPYRHQANGMAERAIKTMLGMLGTVVSETHDDWDECLPAVRMAYNTSFNKAAGETPFFLIYGTDPSMPSDYMLGADEPEYKNMKEYNRCLVKRLRIAWKAAEESNTAEQEKHRTRHNRKPGRGFVVYEPNDLVYVFSPVKPTGLSRKLLRQWSGPYRVVEKAKESVYLVVPANGKATRPMPVHVERMKTFTERQQRLAAPAVMTPKALEQDPAAAPTGGVPPIEILQRQAHQARAPTAEETALIGKIFRWKKKKNELYQIRSISWSEDHGRVVAGCRAVTLNRRNKIVPASGSRQALEMISIEEAFEFVSRDAQLNARAISLIMLE